MNDPLKMVEKLAARAREQKPPSVDVADGVIQRIRQGEEPGFNPLMVFAAGSLASAAGVAVFSASLLYTITDPLWSLFEMTPIIW